jgi:hypothetical protein
MPVAARNVTIAAAVVRGESRCRVNLLIAVLMSVVAATTPPATSIDKPSAASAERVAVFLQTDARDAVGADYVTRLRQALDASGSYRPVSSPSGARFTVGILTMDPNEAVDAGRGQATVAAVTLRHENGAGLNEFVYSWVLVARRDNVASLAAALLAAIDREIQTLDRTPVIVFDTTP